MRRFPPYCRAWLLPWGLALSACEGTLTLDLQADAPAPAGLLTLVVERVELVHSDGGIERFAVEQDLRIDSNGLAPTRLLSGETLRDGRYSTVRLGLRASDSRFDPDTTDNQVALEINLLTNPAEAIGPGFQVNEDELTELRLHLSSFASLGNTSDAGRSRQDVDPVLRLSDIGSTHSISFTLSNLDSFSTVCANPVSGLPRLYVFAEAPNQLLSGIDGGTDDPQRVLHAQPSTGSTSSRRWRASALPAGNYRIALSCSADDPSLNDSVEFFCASTVTVNSDASIDLVANSTDGNCPSPTSSSASE